MLPGGLTHTPDAMQGTLLLARGVPGADLAGGPGRLAALLGVLLVGAMWSGMRLLMPEGQGVFLLLALLAQLVVAMIAGIISLRDLRATAPWETPFHLSAHQIRVGSWRTSTATVSAVHLQVDDGYPAIRFVVGEETVMLCFPRNTSADALARFHEILSETCEGARAKAEVPPDLQRLTRISGRSR